MKKFGHFLLGTIAGIVLATTISVSADDLKSILVGKKVEKTIPVKLNGRKLSKDGIIVDGSTYVPLRAASQDLGLKIDLKNNEVVLSSKGSDKVIQADEEAKKWENDMVKRAFLANAPSKINGLKTVIDGLKKENDQLQILIDQLKKNIEQQQSMIEKGRESFATFNPDPNKFSKYEETPSYIDGNKNIEKIQQQISQYMLDFTNRETEITKYEKELVELEKQYADAQK